MKFNFVIFICATLAINNFALGSLEPEISSQENSKNERKSAKALEDESSEQGEKTTSASSSEETDDGKIIKIFVDDLSFPSGGIKIIKAPDLSKDNEGKKITDTLAMMLENQEKWIQKIEEELEEINKNESAEEEQTEREKTADEIEGNH